MLLYRVSLGGIALFTSILCFAFSLLMAIVSEARFERLAFWMLKITHFFFGPILFSMTVWALLNPGSSLYLCGRENTDPNQVNFSVSNLFALVLCLLISSVLTFYYLAF